MATATSTTAPKPAYDVLRRYLKRNLPVKLTREEQTDIAIAAAKQRLEIKQLEGDLDAEKKRRQAQINEKQREVDVKDRELATGEQERIVSCDEIFRDGMVFVVRTDTWEEFESRPATAQEAQKFLPGVESTLNTSPTDRAAPLLDQAAAAQGKAPANDDAAAAEPDGGADAEAGDDQDDPESEDDGLSEQTPAQRAAAESAKARKARRAKGKTK